MCFIVIFFFFNYTSTTVIYTLSLHDALPICIWEVRGDPKHFTSSKLMCWVAVDRGARLAQIREDHETAARDRKSTRLNSSHPSISYAVFCLKKKKTKGPKRNILLSTIARNQQ